MRPTILLVEDMLVNMKYLDLVLEKYDCNILNALNGKEAVDIVSKEKVDLIFMDIQMPVMDGLQATLAIRRENKELPIVATTAYGMNYERTLCLASGFTDYLQKPLSFDDIRKILKEHLPECILKGN